MTDDMRMEYELQIQELKRAQDEAIMTLQQSKTEQNIRSTRGISIPRQRGVTGPHIANLNEDPMLSGYLKQGIKEGENLVGRRNPSYLTDIIIEGLGIGLEHCRIVRTGNTCVIHPSQDQGVRTIVNGQVLMLPQELVHQDRIRFGNHNCLFIDSEELSNKQIDWEFAVKEANEEEVKGISQQLEEDRRKEEEKEHKLKASSSASSA
jgi:kinesin family protein 1